MAGQHKWFPDSTCRGIHTYLQVSDCVTRDRKKNTIFGQNAKPAVCKWSIINDPHEDSGASILCGLEIRKDQHQYKDSSDLLSTQAYRSENQYSDWKLLCHFSDFPLTHYFHRSFCVPGHTDCASLQGVRTRVLALLHYSSSILGVAVLFFLPSAFFWKTFFLAQVSIIKHPADEANSSESKSERTAEHAGPAFSDYKCNSLNVFCCVLLGKKIASGVCILTFLK